MFEDINLYWLAPCDVQLPTKRGVLCVCVCWLKIFSGIRRLPWANMDVSPQQIKVLTLQFHDGKPTKTSSSHSTSSCAKRSTTIPQRTLLFGGILGGHQPWPKNMGVTWWGLETPWPATEHPFLHVYSSIDRYRLESSRLDWINLDQIRSN